MPHIKNFLILIICLLLHPAYGQKEVNLGVLIDCENPQSVQFAEKILEEARVLLGSKPVLVLKEENILYSDCNVDKVIENFKKLLSDENIDMVLGMNVIGSHIMARGGPYEKPVVATVILNVQAQEIPITRKNASGIKNLSYLELPVSPIRDIEIFQQLIGLTALIL